MNYGKSYEMFPRKKSYDEWVAYWISEASSVDDDHLRGVIYSSLSEVADDEDLKFQIDKGYVTVDIDEYGMRIAQFSDTNDDVPQDTAKTFSGDLQAKVEDLEQENREIINAYGRLEKDHKKLEYQYKDAVLNVVLLEKEIKELKLKLSRQKPTRIIILEGE
jgi:hypothetical protein